MATIRILGPVDLVDEAGGSLSIGGPRQRRLLAAFAVRQGEVVTVSALSEVVWPDGGAPEDPRNALQTYISRLRAAGVAIDRSAAGYRLSAEGSEIDAQSFEQEIGTAARHGERGEADIAAALVAEALSRWRGIALAGFEDEEWARAEASRLDELRVRAREQLAELAIERGVARDHISEIRALCDDHPLRDAPHRLLMLAHEQMGDRAAALRMYQDFRRRLIEETGLDPSTEMVALERRIAAGQRGRPSGAPPSRLGSYDVGELIGEGAFGAIYRAEQSSVGREVAIKVVRAEFANDPQFVRRFEIEAQTVARLEHPHIVPLYDYWRDPSGAYLVMRYLSGGSAEQRTVRDGPWSLDDVGRLVDEIGPALAVAHEAGVLHRDVKPANVLFDDVGNSYLADFGIATSIGGQSATELSSAGSPLYVAPEQARDGGATPASDIYAFGIVLFELLTGRPPFADASSVDALLDRKVREAVPSISLDRPDIAPEVDLVVRTATSTDPAQRFGSMGELVLAFRAARAEVLRHADTTSDSVRAPLPRQGSRPRLAAAQTLIGLEMASSNPYKGLEAFEEADSSDFFGRAQLVDRLDRALQASRFLVVTGPSGSGKSSVVRAGLKPLLRERGSFVASLVPGEHPMEQLETALLRVATTPTGALLEQLSADARGLGRAVKTMLPDDDGELVLVVDQFEELFTVSDAGERDRFLAGLAAAVSEPRSQLRVVCTLRADFYDRPLRHPAVSGLVSDNTIAVTPMTGGELADAIAGPARNLGVEVEPALVAELVAQTTGRNASLPMLQYVLTEVFERRANGEMTLASYRAVGGLAGAMTERAERIYDQLSDDERVAASRAFIRLVTPGEGTEDTRRRVLHAELVAIAPAVVDAYGVARLLTFDADPTTREPRVQLAHEALLREWPRLRSWIDDNRDGLRLLRHLGEAARTWLAAARPPEELYRGGRLEAAEAWTSGSDQQLTELEQEFLDASIAQRGREVDSERRRLRRLKALVLAMTFVALVALVAGVVAFQQQERANAAADAADDRRLAADAVSSTTVDRRLGLLLGIELQASAPSVESLGVLQRTLLAAPDGWQGWIDTGGTVRHAGGLSDATVLLADERGVTTIDVRGVEPAMRVVDSADVSSLAVDGQEDIFVVGHRSGAWSLRDRRGAVLAAGSFESEVSQVEVNAALGLVAIAVGGESPFVEVLDLHGVSLRRVDRELFVWQLEFHDTRPLLAIGHGQLEPAQVVDVDTGEEGPPLATGRGVVFGAGSLAWVGDELLIASARSLAVVDPVTSDLVAEQVETSGSFQGAGFLISTPDGVIVRGSEGPIQRYRDGSLETLIDDDQLGVTSTATLIPGGGQLLVADNAGGMHAYDLDRVPLLAETRVNGPFHAAELGEDGRVLYTWEFGGPPASSWALRDGARPTSLPSSLGKSLASGGRVFFLGRDGDGEEAEDFMATLDDGDLHRLAGEFVTVNTAAYGPGDLLAISGPFGDDGEGTVRVVDAISGELIHRFRDVEEQFTQLLPNQRYAPDLEFTPDGEVLIVASRTGAVHFYSTSTWEPVRDPIAPDDGFHALDFTSDGRVLTFRWDPEQPTMALRDADTMELIAGPAPAPTAISLGGQSPDVLAGDRFAVFGGAPGGAYLWSLDEMAVVGTAFPHVTDFRQPGVASEASLVATTVEGGVVVWDLDTTNWINRACEAAGRNLTRAEWDEYGPSGEPYRASCPQWPLER